MNLFCYQRVHSPFSCNVVLIRKENGALRFCIDVRELNSRTVRDAYSLPRIEETIDTHTNGNHCVYQSGTNCLDSFVEGLKGEISVTLF